MIQIRLNRDHEESSDAELAALGALCKVLDSRHTDELRERLLNVDICGIVSTFF